MQYTAILVSAEEVTAPIPIPNFGQTLAYLHPICKGKVAWVYDGTFKRSSFSNRYCLQNKYFHSTFNSRQVSMSETTLFQVWRLQSSNLEYRGMWIMGP